MIKFFRHIRHSMLNQNRVSRYIFYAIGEIFLVVIGILIALQINNWNEGRKARGLELTILQDLHRDLILTKQYMIEDININKLSIRKMDVLLEKIDNNEPYDESMDTLFHALSGWSSPYPVLTAYEIYKDRGVETVTNDSIKDGIINLYESTFTLLVNDYDRAEWSVYQNVSNPFVIKNFSHSYEEGKTLLKPNNYRDLSTDPTLRNFITFQRVLRTKGIQNYNRTITEIDNLLIMLEEEIKTRF